MQEGVRGAGPNFEYLSAIKVSVKDKSRFQKRSMISQVERAIALELSIDEAKDLLNSAGFAFSRSSKTDIIVAYFLQNKLYDMFEIMNYCSLYSIYVSTNNERGKKIVYM